MTSNQAALKAKPAPIPAQRTGKRTGKRAATGSTSGANAAQAGPPHPPSGLDALAPLRKQLLQRQALAAELAARAAAAEAARRDEEELFTRSVGKVTPLRVKHGRGDDGLTARPKPAPVPRQRLLDNAAVLHEALSDEMSIELLLETDANLSFKRSQLGPDVLRKLRRGVWVVHAELDLHGARSEQARTRLSAFIHQALNQGWRCVRVVHGKGLGSPGRVPVLKEKVLRWLVQKEEVLAFVQARPDDGGAGALVVLLRAG